MDTGGEFNSHCFASACDRYRIPIEFTDANATSLNGVVERVIADADTLQTAARIQVPFRFPESGNTTSTDILLGNCFFRGRLHELAPFTSNS